MLQPMASPFGWIPAGASTLVETSVQQNHSQVDIATCTWCKLQPQVPSPTAQAHVLQTQLHAFIHAYIHAYMHTYIHAYMHTYMHACIYVYIHLVCTCVYISTFYLCTYLSIHLTIYLSIHTYIYGSDLGSPEPTACPEEPTRVPVAASTFRLTRVVSPPCAARLSDLSSTWRLMGLRNYP